MEGKGCERRKQVHYLAKEARFLANFLRALKVTVWLKLFFIELDLRDKNFFHGLLFRVCNSFGVLLTKIRQIKLSQ